ncbi:hypothetical protein GKE82_05905 [Conexibacter sp. W3-3-2]|nr:hypothetical protein [Conexibacter sp. W3-3-2]MTD43850.1 hypothetical protein [Conexibacter sp. W3-3-2]
MRATLTQFIAGAFALIGLYLVVSNATGFGKSVAAIGDASSQVFRTLQAR